MSNINEIEAKDVNLSSFKIKKELNPKFWPNGKLNSRIRLRLMDIADDFVNELAIDWVKPDDVIFTGSIANYNWSRYSDVDLHILIDFKKVYPKNQDFVDDYFKAKKENWLSNHEDLKIFGYPIEISVEDSNEDNPSSGRYSLYKNKWIAEPDDFQDAVINQEFVKKRAAMFMTQIDDIEKKFNNEQDTHKCEKYGDKVYKIFDKLKNMRSEGLASDKKEMSSGNIIYKIIRRTGYLDKIWDIVNSSYDKVNSIEEKREINEAQDRGEKFSAGILPFRMNNKGNTEVFLGFPGQPKNKDFQPPQWMNRWSILKGQMENGEDPLKCAVREFCEESGVSPKLISPTNLISLGSENMEGYRNIICYGLDLTDDEQFDTTNFHSNPIDKKEFIELNGGNAYPEMEKYSWKEVKSLSGLSQCEMTFCKKCDEICQTRYSNEKSNKTVIISESQKRIINEFLSKQNLIPLKNYFDKYSYEQNMIKRENGSMYWNGEYSEEQINDLFNKFKALYPKFIMDNLEDILREEQSTMDEDEFDEYYSKIEDELYEYSEIMKDYEENENKIEISNLYNKLVQKYGQEEEFKEYLVRQMHNGNMNHNLPTWSTQMKQGINKKREWLIHFSNSADKISQEGFKFGNDIEDLAVTKKYTNGSYAFAYPLDDFFFVSKNNEFGGSPHLFKNGSYYGKEAIMFQASGIKTWHRTDHEYQVIFDKNEASNLIYLHNNDGIWYIKDTLTNRPIITKKNMYDLIKWVLTNFDQYKNHIVLDNKQKI